MSRFTDFAHSLTQSASSAVHGVHGMGEVIRGTANSTMDGLVPNHESKEGGGRARQDEITTKGLNEMRGAEAHLHGGGAYPGGSGDGGNGDGAWGAHTGNAPVAGSGGGGYGVAAGQATHTNTPYGGSSGAGQGHHLSGAVSGQDRATNQNWSPPSAIDMQRQEREQEKLWDAERKEREAGYQQQQQHVPDSFPDGDATEQPPQQRNDNANFQQPHRQAYQPPPPPAPPVVYGQPGNTSYAPASNLNQAPPQAQPQGQGFQQHTLRNASPASPTMRNRDASNGSNHHSMNPFHHKPAERGEGKWLSQGGVRKVSEEFGANNAPAQGWDGHQGGGVQGRDAGAEAARLAWNSGKR